MLPTVCDVSKKIGLATGTGIRRPLEIIVNSVTAYTPIDEIVYVRYNSRPQNPIWGQFRKFAQQPSAYTGEKTFVEIRYASHLSRDFYRFIVCKELCHALDSDEGTHSVTNRAVTRLINTFALWSANKPASGVGTPAVDAETYAEIGALELLCPIDYRESVMTEDGDAQLALAARFGLPTEYALLAFGPRYVDMVKAWSA